MAPARGRRVEVVGIDLARASPSTPDRSPAAACIQPMRQRLARHPALDVQPQSPRDLHASRYEEAGVGAKRQPACPRDHAVYPRDACSISAW